jgi:hypothetical protein
MVRLADAERFIWANARLIDRRRYAYHFQGADAASVLTALRPYQNADGGFGNALEPDLRGPDSQPLAVATALLTLDEIDAFDDPLVANACDYLVTTATPEGGVPFIAPSALGYPFAPYLGTSAAPPASLNPTATIAGLLHNRGYAHPWLGAATAFCWRTLDAWQADEAYTARAALTFLKYVPDRARADATAKRVGAALMEHKLIELDPHAPGEVHQPLDFAPTPDSPARSWFSDDTLATHLDALAAAQQGDGGWHVNWQIWMPVTGPAWNGWKTLDALLTLRAWGRLG